METTEEFIKRIKDLPEDQRRTEIDKICIVWDMDYDIVRDLCILNGQDFELTRAEYRQKCKDFLEENFGYASFFGVTEEQLLEVQKKLMQGCF